MSREGLKEFLYSLEHSGALRRELGNCETDNDLIKLAKENGFLVNKSDLETSEESQRIEEWFRSCNIKPIKN